MSRRHIKENPRDFEEAYRTYPDLGNQHVLWCRQFCPLLAPELAKPALRPKGSYR
jgi:hypothetical protein